MRAHLSGVDCNIPLASRPVMAKNLNVNFSFVCNVAAKKNFNSRVDILKTAKSVFNARENSAP